MKSILIACVLILGAPVAHATGLIDLDPANAKALSAQKKLKHGVDAETEKHSVKVGADEKKPSKKKAAAPKPAAKPAQ